MADTKRNTHPIRPRNVYWLVLTLVVTAIVLSRYSTIWPGSLSFLDQGLLVFLAILLVLPLAVEFEAFGFKLRREIEETKNDLVHRIDLLHATVQTSIGVRSDVNVTVPLYGPEQLQRLEQAVRKERPAVAPNIPEGPEGRVPADVRFLFAVRYLLEQALDDTVPGLSDNRLNHRQRATILMREGHLSQEDRQAFDQVWLIASRAIHGETVEQSYVAFVRDTFPYLLNALSHIRKVAEDDG